MRNCEASFYRQKRPQRTDFIKKYRFGDPNGTPLGPEWRPKSPQIHDFSDEVVVRIVSEWMQTFS